MKHDRMGDPDESWSGECCLRGRLTVLMPLDWGPTNRDMDAVLQATADAMKGQLDVHNRAANTLLGNIRMLENKVSEAATKKETLKARAITAQVAALCCFSVHKQSSSIGGAFEVRRPFGARLGM
jgi:hypothetical protein